MVGEADANGWQYSTEISAGFRRILFFKSTQNIRKVIQKGMQLSPLFIRTTFNITLDNTNINTCFYQLIKLIGE